VTPELFRALLTIASGAIAGGLTNTVAVWMLFHPYEPPRIGPLRLKFLHGAIPKNQDRLAEAVGRTVGNRLLTQDDLTGILANEEFRAAFDERLADFLVGLLETTRGPVREILPPEIVAELEALLDGAADLLEERLAAWLDSEAFEELVDRRVRELVERISDRTVGEVLTPAREEALATAIETWVSDLVEREGFREAIDSYIDRTFRSFLTEDRTFEEVLPAGLVGSLERALSGYLPIAVRKLGGILEDPEARSRLESTVHDLFQRFLRDLRFHQRIVARLVVTEDTLDRVLDTIESEGSEHLSEMLRDPAVQEATARRVNEAVLDLLQRPITSVLGHPGDESVEGARETVVGWVVGMSRDEETLSFLFGKLRQGLGKASEGTWGDLLDGVPPERLSAAVTSVARSGQARRAYREVLGRVLHGLLSRPIGRPADWLPADSTPRIQRALAEPLWGWIQTQIPHVVNTLDVGRRVEEKVRGFPTPKMEELVRRVTQRELRLIVHLGYVLGAAIGLVLVGLNALFG
jgi:uncharacterized membrane protein YheB (UPF0754 family)